jgi:hypothetical protein
MLNKKRPDIDPEREKYAIRCMEDGDFEKMEFEQEPHYELIEVLVFFDFQPEEPMTRHYPGCSASFQITEVLRDDNYEEICLLPKEKEMWEEQILDDIEYRRRHDPRW